MRIRYRSIWASAMLLLIIPFSGGCGEPKVCRVSGTVRVGGKAIPSVVVNFVPTEGRPSSGLTDDKGAFKLKYNRDQEGVEKGVHKVYFTFRGRTTKEQAEYESGKITLSPEVTSLLERYGKLDSTTLTYEVTKDGQVIDINID